jgi:iron complex outermembrane receptor protein
MAHLHTSPQFRPPSRAEGPRPTRVAAATALLLGACGLAAAQNTAGTLPTVVIQERSAPRTADVTGFGDEPLARSPISATVISSDTISAIGARRLNDLYRLDASVGDAYNAIGYYDFASVRGFVLDSTYNFRREGLPISAETSLPLDHLERVELLKGTSGIQAGTSAPGGLFNAIVKRPTQQPLRALRLELNDTGNALAHLDTGGRLGADGALGFRFNLVGERLNSAARGTEGQRGLVALALDAKLSPDSLLEGEFEWSRRSQPSVPGLSLLGNRLPAADPRLNINTQPWSQPVTFQNFSGSLRYTQAINSSWNWQAQLGTQRLVNDDFLAYPYGCFDNSSSIYYADRYCPNGDFDLYDFRSLDEQRNAHAAQWRVNGQWQTGAASHRLSAGVLTSRYRQLGQPQADNNAAAGTGNLFTRPDLPAVADFTDPYTNRNERSTEWFVTDAIRWSERFETWLGLRHTRLDRNSVRTDGSRATDYSQSLTTPWLAVTWALSPQAMLYGSWGQGVESEVAPGRSRYTNAGQPLPALKSRQWELGIRQSDGQQRWSATVFNIVKPVSNNLLVGAASSCSATGSCTRVIDGDVRHLGLELGAATRLGGWALDGSATWIRAQRRGSVVDPTLNGQRPTNVPNWALRANLSHPLPAVPGLTLGAHLSHEGRRSVLPDASLQLPSWTRVDASLRYQTRIQNHPVTWILAIDNLFDRQYFKESPYQYDHIYLFPAAPRTLRLALETQF